MIHEFMIISSLFLSLASQFIILEQSLRLLEKFGFFWSWYISNLIFQSDSEYIAGQLSAFGYNLSENEDKADMWLINTLDYFLAFIFLFFPCNLPPSLLATFCPIQCMNAVSEVMISKNLLFFFLKNLLGSKD